MDYIIIKYPLVYPQISETLLLNYFLLMYNATHASNLIPTAMAINNPYRQINKKGTYITQSILRRISQLGSSFTPLNHTLLGQTGNEHTLTPISTGINAPNHLINDQRTESISLIIKLIKSILPEYIENIWCNEESSDCHPQPICEGRERETDHEDGE
jgi:hypothetical protein